MDNPGELPPLEPARNVCAMRAHAGIIRLAPPGRTPAAADHSREPGKRVASGREPPAGERVAARSTPAWRIMPRILLLSPAFPMSFWSMSWAVKLSGATAAVAPLGLITVAAMLPQTWPVRLVDRNLRDVAEDDWNGCDTVLISAMVPQRKDTGRLIAEAKSRGKHVVVGGPYATSLPDDLFKLGADVVVCGEAEPLREPLLQAIRDRGSGLRLTCTDKPDLATCPIPRFDLLEHDKYATLAVQTTRGCPFNCEFCDITAIYGRSMRVKQPEQVIAELEALRKTGYQRAVFLSDDNFIGDIPKAKHLLRHLAEWLARNGSPFDFYTQVSINVAQDKELQDLLTSANVGCVFIGLESPDPDALTTARKNQNVRHPMAESLKTLRDNGITVTGSFILGLDGEKTNAGEAIRQLVEEVAIPEAMINVLTAAPNTRLWARLEAEGRLMGTAEAYCERTITQGLNFEPQRPREEIYTELLALWQALYSQKAYMDRALRYFSAMRPTRRAMRGDAASKLAGVDVPDRRLSDLERRRRLRTAIRFLFHFGVASSQRLRFWRNTLLLMRRNPSRLSAYFEELVHCEAIRKMLPDIIRELQDLRT